MQILISIRNFGLESQKIVKTFKLKQNKLLEWKTGKGYDENEEHFILSHGVGSYITNETEAYWVIDCQWESAVLFFE